MFDPDPTGVPFVVPDGTSGEINFNRPNNGVEDTTEIPLVCGDTVYEVVADATGTPLSSAWAYTQADVSVADLFQLVVDTTVDLTLIGTETEVTKTVYV